MNNIYLSMVKIKKVLKDFHWATATEAGGCDLDKIKDIPINSERPQKVLY